MRRHQVMTGGGSGSMVDIPRFDEKKGGEEGIFTKIAGFGRGEDQSAFGDVPHEKVQNSALPPAPSGTMNLIAATHAPSNLVPTDNGQLFAR